MPLPDDFSPWEHLQSVFTQTHNRWVREEFADLVDDDDITTPRGSQKVACLMRDDDNLAVTFLRLWYFYVLVRKASDFHPDIYGIPLDLWQERVTFQPQVILHFFQDLDGVPIGRKPVRSRIGFRLHTETAATFNPTEALNLANKIRTEFATGGGYRFNRGKERYTYREKDRGYDFRLHVTGESEAREVISKVLDLRSHAPDWDHLKHIADNLTYPTNPGTHQVYGKARQKVAYRPTAAVRFQWAELHVHGLPHAVVLVDRTRKFKKPLVKA